MEDVIKTFRLPAIPYDVHQKAILCFTDENGHIRSQSKYCFLAHVDGAMAKVLVAIRTFKDKCTKRYIPVEKVVGIYFVNGRRYVRDIHFTYIGGYSVEWDEDEIYDRPAVGSFSDVTDWSVRFNPWAMCLNPEYSAIDPEYRYSFAWESNVHGTDILEYLEMYSKHQRSIELLVKAGFSAKLFLSKKFLRMVETNADFRKFVTARRDEINSRYCTCDPIVEAYKNGCSIENAQRYLSDKNYVLKYRKEAFPAFKKVFPRYKDYAALCDYIEAKQKVYNMGSFLTYCDYLEAADYLGLDMNDTKNRFPDRFKYWHDMRIDQMASKKADAALKEKLLIDKHISETAEKVKYLESTVNGFMFICARSKGELIEEGELLHHCVGRMNYDAKMARGETVIVFIRNEAEPGKPFVTIEYDPKRQKVLQCYGEHGSRPADNVLNTVYVDWLSLAKEGARKCS